MRIYDVSRNILYFYKSDLYVRREFADIDALDERIFSICVK